jgi:hypothetical protein
MSQQVHNYFELKITKVIRFCIDIAPIKMQHPEKIVVCIRRFGIRRGYDFIF